MGRTVSGSGGAAALAPGAPPATPVGDGAGGGDDGGSDGGDDDGVGSPLRGAVTGLRREVWRKWQMDLYTRSPEEPLSPEVDHIIEIQVAHYAMLRTLQRELPAGVRVTRAAVRSFVDLAKPHINGVLNLNVTARDINRAKMGPFKAFLHRLESVHRGDSVSVWGRDEDDIWGYVRKTGKGLSGEDGTWQHIERAVTGACDEVVNRFSPDGGLGAAYAEELGDMLAKMKFQGQS